MPKEVNYQEQSLYSIQLHSRSLPMFICRMLNKWYLPSILAVSSLKYLHISFIQLFCAYPAWYFSTLSLAQFTWCFCWESRFGSCSPWASQLYRPPSGLGLCRSSSHRLQWYSNTAYKRIWLFANSAPQIWRNASVLHLLFSIQFLRLLTNSYGWWRS